eukprot:1112158_1
MVVVHPQTASALHPDHVLLRLAMAHVAPLARLFNIHRLLCDCIADVLYSFCILFGGTIGFALGIVGASLGVCGGAYCGGGATVTALNRSVPTAVPGIMFLFGG